MRLQLWASHTKGCIEFNRPHRWIWLEDNFYVVIKIHIEIDLAGAEMRSPVNFTEICMSFRCAAAGWAKQIPGHIEYSCTSSSQKHLQNRAAILIPMIGEGVRTNMLKG